MKSKESVTTKIKRLLPHVRDLAAIKEIETAIRNRREAIRAALKTAEPA